MKRNKLFWGLLIFCAINFAAHLCFYGSLPDVVPTHWGADGQANSESILCLCGDPDGRP